MDYPDLRAGRSKYVETKVKGVEAVQMARKETTPDEEKGAIFWVLL